jgi:hypothetical protein
MNATMKPAASFRLATPSFLIDLNRVPGLSGVRLDGATFVGAMTRQRELLTNPLVARPAPLLVTAVPHVGHVQTRNRGTVGGSLAQADPSPKILPDLNILESDEFSLRGKTENTHILQVLSVKMNFSGVKRYGLPARKSEDVGGTVSVAKRHHAFFKHFRANWQDHCSMGRRMVG